MPIRKAEDILSEAEERDYWSSTSEALAAIEQAQREALEASAIVADNFNAGVVAHHIRALLEPVNANQQ